MQSEASDVLILRLAPGPVPPSLGLGPRLVAQGVTRPTRGGAVPAELLNCQIDAAVDEVFHRRVAVRQEDQVVQDARRLMRVPAAVDVRAALEQEVRHVEVAVDDGKGERYVEHLLRRGRVPVEMAARNRIVVGILRVSLRQWKVHFRQVRTCTCNAAGVPGGDVARALPAVSRDCRCHVNAAKLERSVAAHRSRHMRRGLERPWASTQSVHHPPRSIAASTDSASFSRGERFSHADENPALGVPHHILPTHSEPPFGLKCIVGPAPQLEIVGACRAALGNGTTW